MQSTNENRGTDLAPAACSCGDPGAITAGSTRSAQTVSSRKDGRLSRLQRIFNWVEDPVKAGVPVRRAIRAVPVRWTLRRYREGKPIRFSRSRLAGLYYAWRRDGDNALILHYYKKHSKASGALLAEFVSQCQADGIFSMEAAHRRLSTTLSVHPFYRALSRTQRLEIRKFHKARLQIKAKGGRLRRLLSTLEDGR